MEPLEVVPAAVAPVQGDPAEIVSHGLGNIYEVVDGLAVRDVAPIYPVIGTPPLSAAVYCGHGEMLQVGVLLALGDLHF